MAVEKYFGLGESPPLIILQGPSLLRSQALVAAWKQLQTSSHFFQIIFHFIQVKKIKISIYFFKNSRQYTNPGWNIPSFAKSDELDTLSASDFSSSSFLLPSKKFLKMTRISENFEYNKAEIKKQYWHLINPFTPKIWVVILLTVCHTTQLLWCYFGEFGIGSTNNPLIYIFLYSDHWSAWY